MPSNIDASAYCGIPEVSRDPSPPRAILFPRKTPAPHLRLIPFPMGKGTPVCPAFLTNQTPVLGAGVRLVWRSKCADKGSQSPLYADPCIVARASDRSGFVK